MIDLFSHFAVLDVLHARLEQEVLAGDAGEDLTNAANALASKHPYAVLGSVVDHLLAHDKTCDVELTVLGKALGVYGDIKQLIADIRDVRMRLEQLALNPSGADALNRFNQIRSDIADIILGFDSISDTIQVFGYQWLEPLSYLVAHPQSVDAPVDQWPWRDIVLSRRTGAFAAVTLDLARQSGRPDALAFGLGVLASYVGNSVASPYLARSVGGPRRSHKLRDRLAAYSTGAWLHHVGPMTGLKPPTPTSGFPSLASPNQPIMPSWLADLIGEALKTTYGDLAPPPDLVIAYRKFFYHWQLLHSFQQVSPPKPINTVLGQSITNNLGPSDFYPPEPAEPANPGPAPAGHRDIWDPGPGNAPWMFWKHMSFWDWFRAILDVLSSFPATIIRAGVWLWAYDGKLPASNSAQTVAALKTPATQSEYETVVAGKNILGAINDIHNVDLAAFFLACQFLKSLKVGGLLYPTAQDLPLDVFAQFVFAPGVPADFHWPARSLASPGLATAFPLAAQTEHPTAAALFAVGEKPAAFLVGGLTPAPFVAGAGYDLFRDEVNQTTTSAVRTTNLNLDGDRGPHESCWRLVPGASINDDPVTVIPLAYTDL